MQVWSVDYFLNTQLMFCKGPVAAHDQHSLLHAGHLIVRLSAPLSMERKRSGKLNKCGLMSLSQNMIYKPLHLLHTAQLATLFAKKISPLIFNSHALPFNAIADHIVV